MNLKDNAYLVAYYTGVLLVGLGTVFPDLRLWAFSNWAYFNSYVQIGVFAFALICPIVIHRVLSKMDLSKRIGLPFAATGLAYTTVITAAFVVFQAKFHLLGDGIVRSNLLPVIDPALRKSDFGAYIIVKQLYRLVDGHVADPVDWAYHFHSYAGGAIFVIITLIFAARLFQHFRERLLFTLIVTTAGSSLLFFGYVENYSIFAASVLLTTLVCLDVCRGRLSRYYIIPALVFTIALHFLGAALIPGAAFAFLYGSSIYERFKRVKGLIKYPVVLAIAIASLIAFLELYDHNYYFRFQFIPIVENRFTIEDYTLFSLKHLADYANLIFLLFPGIIMAAALLLFSRGQGFFKKPEMKSLLVTTTFCTVIAFLFYPQLGMPRDWDLFPFAGIPLSVLGAYIIVGRDKKPFAIAASALLALLLNLMVLSGRVGAQIYCEAVINQMKDYGRLDPQKYVYIHKLLVDECARRHDAETLQELRLMSKTLSPEISILNTGTRLREQGKFDDAILQLKLALVHNPMLAPAYHNIGSCYLITNRFDSARAYFEIADGWNPNHPEILNELGFACANMHDYKAAEKCWKKLLLVDRAEVTGRLNLLDLYTTTGESAKKVSLLKDAVLPKDLPAGLLKQFGDHYYSIGLVQDAKKTYQRSITSGIDSLSAQEIYSKFPALQPPS